MSAKKIYVASLGPGRCFVHKATESDSAHLDVAESDNAVTGARTVMTPDSVWKVLTSSNEEVSATNALGQDTTLPGNTLVNEVPRGGYDRLVQRIADPNDPLGS